MRIYLDSTGGDNAPKAVVEGAIEALRKNKDLYIVLGGKESAINPFLKDCDDIKKQIEIDECSEEITNCESPVMGVRKKKDSAIVKGMLALRDKTVDGFVSAGSTGAVLAGGMFRLGRIPGIERPALAPMLPNGKSFFLLIDCGANIDCKPKYLAQFGIMGSAFMQSVRGIDNPRVGLLNIGAEAEKGNALVKETYPLMEKCNYNFVGNIEARDITADKTDVLVCDGFSGNIILKYTEGIASTLMGIIKREITRDFISKIGALIDKPAYKRVAKAMDYTEVGGAPLLGVNGVVVKAHGSSDAHAIASAIKQTEKMISVNLPKRIQEGIVPQA